MNVEVAEAAQTVLRNTGTDERRKIGAWIDSLKRWEEDPFIREHSKKLDANGNVYVLQTTTDVRIFFELQDRSITVLDVARKSAILRSAPAPGADSA